MNKLTISDIKQNNQYLSFNVGRKKYALPVVNVLEIIELPFIKTSGNRNANTVGFLKFNSIPVSIIDVRLFLEEEIDTYSVNNKIILAKTDEIMFGIIADNAEGLVEISDNTFNNVTDNDNFSIINSVYTYDNAPLYLLDLSFIEDIIKNPDKTNKNTFLDLLAKDKQSLDIFNQRSLKLNERFNQLAAQNVFYENRFVTFLLDNTTFCLDLNYTKEFIPLGNITPLPCTPDYIEGLICVRGEFITVLNLKRFLNYPKYTYTKDSKIIVINSKEYKLGLLTDDIFEIISISDEKIHKNENKSDDNFISEEYIEAQSVKPILNLQKLIRDERLNLQDN